MIFVNHGDPDAADAFTACLNDEKGFKAFAPYSGTSFDLLSGEFIESTEGKPIVKEKPLRGRRARARRVSPVFVRLISAAERLLRVAKKMEGRPNKELGSYADQINRMADKMEK